MACEEFLENFHSLSAFNPWGMATQILWTQVLWTSGFCSQSYFRMSANELHMLELPQALSAKHLQTISGQ